MTVTRFETIPVTVPHFLDELVEEFAPGLLVQRQPAVHDVELGNVAENGRDVEVVEGRQRVNLGPEDVVQSPFAGQQIFLPEDERHLRLFLELAAGKAPEVDVEVRVLIRSHARHHVEIGVAAELAVEVADLGVAQVQVEAEVLPQEAVLLLQRFGIEIRRQLLSVETPQQEVHERVVLLGQVPADLLQHGLKARPVGVLVVRRQERQTGDDVFVIAHVSSCPT